MKALSGTTFLLPVLLALYMGLPPISCSPATTHKTPQKPKGFCPPNVLPPGIDATTCDVQCDNCRETEMCCSYGCRRICRPMSKERPGFCPFDPKLCLPIRFKCQSDSDCPDNTKCCDYDCERKCVPLLTEKPGTCPLSTPSCPAVNGLSTPNCTSDYHCTGSQKCCTVDCIKTCAQPELMKQKV